MDIRLRPAPLCGAVTTPRLRQGFCPGLVLVVSVSETARLRRFCYFASIKNARFLGCFFGGRNFTQPRGIYGFAADKKGVKKPRFLVNTFFQKSKIFISCKINDLRIFEFWPNKVSKNLGFCYTFISEFVCRKSKEKKESKSCESGIYCCAELL